MCHHRRSPEKELRLPRGRRNVCQIFTWCRLYPSHPTSSAGCVLGGAVKILPMPYSSITIPSSTCLLRELATAWRLLFPLFLKPRYNAAMQECVCVDVIPFISLCSCVRASLESIVICPQLSLIFNWHTSPSIIKVCNCVLLKYIPLFRKNNAFLVHPREFGFW